MGITTKTCTAKVAKQTKTFDDKCSGFYVSVTPKGVATFSLKYWNKFIGKQATVPIGVYDPAHLTVEHARAKAYDLKARAAHEDISKAARQEKAQTRTLSGVTVGQVIDEYLAYIKTPVPKADGEKRPRIESWYTVACWIEKDIRPVLGDKVASEVTNNDIAKLQAKVAARTVSGARQVRSALNRIFAFAAEAGRSYITASPCVYLPKLDKEYERTRVLKPDEIRTLWWGLDHPDVPCQRSIALALKFELVSMLRSQEIITARRKMVVGLGGKDPVLRVPLKFVKKRRVISQPLNSLAVEILQEIKHNGDLYFPNTRTSEPDVELARSALNKALHGVPNQNKVGIREFLGMEHFTPHDLRRTAATLAGDLGFDDVVIAKCLDHSKARGEDVVEAPTVTGRVYNQSKRLDEKREVLDAVDAALREIIGTKPVKLRLAA